KNPPTLRRLAPAGCPPRGRFLPWGGPAAKESPHAAQAGACWLPPKGALFALGRPGGKRIPPRCAGWRLLAAPQGGAFCLGAARRQNNPPTLRRLAPAGCPPRGRFLPWGGPAAKKTAWSNPRRDDDWRGFGRSGQ